MRYGFTPDLSKVSAIYREDSGTAQSFGGSPARAFSGSVSLWDTHSKLITLNSEVEISDCGTAGNTVVLYGVSNQPRDGETWKQIDRIGDGFRCSR
jgi:hypothetical protein